MNIRRKFAVFAVAVSVVSVLSGCYAGAPATQVPESGISKPKPGTQQGYQQVPTPITLPDPTPVPEPEPTPEPTATPEA